MSNVINFQEKRDEIDAKEKHISEIIDTIMNLAIGIYNNLAETNPHLNIEIIDNYVSPPAISDGLFNLSVAIVIDCARNSSPALYQEAIDSLGNEQSLLAACCVVGKNGLHTAFEDIRALQ